MTELETLQRAKMYMEKLANGIDPITDTPVSEGDAVNNVRLSRCFFYVCGVLDRAMDQERNAQRKEMQKNRVAFHMTMQELSRIRPLEGNVYISSLVNHINSFVDENTMKKLTVPGVTAWLMELGLLEVLESGTGRKPTPRGENLGIFTEHRTGPRGDYQAVLYTPAAQQFILDNLSATMDQTKPTQLSI